MVVSFMHCSMDLHSFLIYDLSSPTVGVTRWWVGRDTASLTEPASSYTNCLKTRRLPPVGCTLCWAAFVGLILKPFCILSDIRSQMKIPHALYYDQPIFVQG